MCVPPWLEIIKECSFGDLGSSAVFNKSAIQRPAYLFLYFSVADCLAMLFKHLAFALAKPNLEATAYTTAAAHQTPEHKISIYVPNPHSKASWFRGWHKTNVFCVSYWYLLFSKIPQYEGLLYEDSKFNCLLWSFW